MNITGTYFRKEEVSVINPSVPNGKRDRACCYSKEVCVYLIERETKLYEYILFFKTNFETSRVKF